MGGQRLSFERRGRDWPVGDNYISPRVEGGGARRKLLSILWGAGRSSSVRDLASDAGMAYAVTHRELHAMWEAGFAARRLDAFEATFRRFCDGEER